VSDTNEWHTKGRVWAVIVNDRVYDPCRCPGVLHPRHGGFWVAVCRTCGGIRPANSAERPLAVVEQYGSSPCADPEKMPKG
jgi:hypothetical protein